VPLADTIIDLRAERGSGLLLMMEH